MAVFIPSSPQTLANPLSGAMQVLRAADVKPLKKKKKASDYERAYKVRCARLRAKQRKGQLSPLELVMFEKNCKKAADWARKRKSRAPRVRLAVLAQAAALKAKLRKQAALTPAVEKVIDTRSAAVIEEAATGVPVEVQIPVDLTPAEQVAVAEAVPAIEDVAVTASVEPAEIAEEAVVEASDPVSVVEEVEEEQRRGRRRKMYMIGGAAAVVAAVLLLRR